MAAPFNDPNVTYVYLDVVEGPGLSGDWRGLNYEDFYWRRENVGYIIDRDVNQRYPAPRIKFIDDNKFVIYPGDSLTIINGDLSQSPTVFTTTTANDLNGKFTQIHDMAQITEGNTTIIAYATEKGLYIADQDDNILYSDTSNPSYAVELDNYDGEIRAYYGSKGKIKVYNVTRDLLGTVETISGSYEVESIAVHDELLSVGMRYQWGRTYEKTGNYLKRVGTYTGSFVSYYDGAFWSFKPSVSMSSSTQDLSNVYMRRIVRYGYGDFSNYLDGLQRIFPAQMYIGSIAANSLWFINYDWRNGKLYVSPNPFKIRIRFAYSGAINPYEWEHINTGFDLRAGELILSLDDLRSQIPPGIVVAWNGLG